MRVEWILSRSKDQLFFHVWTDAQVLRSKIEARRR